MMEQMQSLMSTISTLQTQVNNNSQTHGRYDGEIAQRGGCEGRGGRHNGRGRGRSGEQLTRQYSWSHGNCFHNGTECETKTEGHIDGATYNNRQNGSDHNCHST